MRPRNRATTDGIFPLTMSVAPLLLTGLLLTGLLLTGLLLATSATARAQQDKKTASDGGESDIVERDAAAAAKMEAAFIRGSRQLTFEGRRAGEGYFSADGKQLVFQSEREPGNPFFQIYLMDLETGDTERISPGQGKTTCAWIHPDGKQVLFASTQADPDARKKQKAELELRASGKERRYSWDYDEHFDITRYDTTGKRYVRLTTARGYDAEGSWSPDGKQIVFASNRRAYSAPMTEREQAMFAMDPAYMMDLYIMNADGTNVRRLTDAPGYDGGPFFSPDGSKICWRRFSASGATAEIMVMNADGTRQRQVTKLGVMSWAPYFHPSGEYLIFTTNRHGFANFELYLVDVAGRSQPVRVTHTAGFDGLPVFTPDGGQLAWTTNRTSSKRSQIFIGSWDHQAARRALKLDHAIARDVRTDDARAAGARSRTQTSPDFQAQDILRHIGYLCRSELQGRLTGTAGEKMATAYVASYFDSLGLQPGGDKKGWYQPFDFTSGVALGKENRLKETSQHDDLAVAKQWQPIAFSKTGAVKPSPVVFAGYGIVAPKREEQDEYDSFVHLDVTGKWVIVLRYLPESIRPERRQFLTSFSSLRYKSMIARDKGAAGMIVVSGPNAKVKNQLVPIRFDGSLAGASIPVISVTNDVAARWLRQAGKDLKKLQDKLDRGQPMVGFPLKDLQLAANIDIQQVKRSGRNVLARLQAGERPSAEVVVIGAHIDHLGKGGTGSSLARDDEKEGIHHGADDNASGVAAMLEVAQYLAHQKSLGKLKMKRDVIFAAWSGEELGLIGSSHFVKQQIAALHRHDHHDHGHSDPHKADPHKADPHKADPHKADPHKVKGPTKKVGKIRPATSPPVQKSATKITTKLSGAKSGGAKTAVTSKSAEAKQTEAKQTEAKQTEAKHAAEAQGDATHGGVSLSLHPHIAACLNMDMVGRLDKKLILQGVGSSSIWAGEIERRNAPVGLSIALQQDSYIPTDASVFFMNGVPILSAFTGSHSEYHTPRDTPDLINYEGTARIARLMGLIARSLIARDKAPDYIPQAGPGKGQRRARLRAYLGTVPDYAETDRKGVLLSGVGKGGPAEKAGVRSGDTIVQLAGKKIDNIYDYTYAIEALKVGETVKIVVLRGNKRIETKITPGSRE